MKTRAIASRLTPRDLAKNSRIVFDDFTPARVDGAKQSQSGKKDAADDRRHQPERAPESQRFEQQPAEKKEADVSFMAFFEPVNRRRPI